MMQRYMRWCRFVRGDVRHLIPSDRAPRTLCGMVRHAGAVLWDRDDTQPKLPICQTCISVITQAGDMLIEAAAETGIKA